MTSFAKTLLFASMITTLAACGAGDGMNNHGVDGGSAGAAGGLAVDGGPAKGAAAFLGTWRYVHGSVTGACRDGSTINVPIQTTATTTFTNSAQPNELVATDDAGCVENCSIFGNVATCASNAPCSGAFITDDSYTLLGGQIHEIAAGETTLDDGTMCEITETDGLLARVQE